MDNNQLLKFFQLQRQIFGVCPKCNTLFRLSDCQVYLKKKPEHDWLQKIEASVYRINGASEKLDEKEELIRERARERGRKQAKDMVKKMDTVFKPRKLDPDDSKVIFHPVDYIVFNGMKSQNEIKSLIFLDRAEKNNTDKRLQKIIEKVIEQEKYEWITLRVDEGGAIKEE